MTGTRLRIWAIGLTMAAGTSSTGAAQDTQELYELLQSAQEALDGTIRDATDGEFGLVYELVSRGDFDRAFADFQNVLQGGDLETLARWFPDAQKLLAYIDAIPGLEPYADWLRQRIDYAAVADEAVRKVPKPLPKPTPPASTSTDTQPAPKAPRSTVTRGDYVRDTDTWTKRLAGRPAPKRAARLVPSLKRFSRPRACRRSWYGWRR